MFTVLRYRISYYLRHRIKDYLRPSWLLLGLVLLFIAALALPWLPPYTPIREAMTLRYLEAEGRSPAQLRERERQQAEAQRRATEQERQRQVAEADARRRAADEAARRQAVEAEAQRRAAQAEANRQAATAEEQRRAAQAASQAEANRQAEAAARRRAADEEEQRRRVEDQAAERRLAASRNHANYVSAFKRIVDRYDERTSRLVAEINRVTDGFVQITRDGGYHHNSWPSLEDISSSYLCNDPAIPGDTMSPSDRRRRNIYACAVHLSNNKSERTQLLRHASTVTNQRLFFPRERATFPLDVLIAHIAIQRVSEMVNNARTIPPAWTDKVAVETEILRGVVPTGFSRTLFETVLTAEQTNLSVQVYADIKRLAELGEMIVEECRNLNRSLGCLVSAY